MLQLWTISNLQRLDWSIRKKITFYAPLTDSIEFFGIPPSNFSRASTSTRTGRDGNSYAVATGVPCFDYSGENALGLYLRIGESVNFNAANYLSNANTLVWFEERIPKSTPTQTNPFDGNGVWTGNGNIHLSHVAKSNAVLANSEINAIQAALLDVVQSIPAPPAPPVGDVGTPITETPSGSGTVFTLSHDPDLNTLIVAWGGLFIKRVGAAPGTLQFTASGSGNRTITLGSTVEAGQDLTAQYWIAP